MVFPARYDYLSRIGALSPMPINALLNVAVPLTIPPPFRLNTGFEQDDLALLVRSPQASRSTQIRPPRNRPPTKSAKSAGKSQDRQVAGMESGRSLFRHRRARSRARSCRRWMPIASRLRPTTRASLREQTAREDGGKWLAEAVRRYEAIDDLAGRLGSYAGLVHAGDSVDPAISKFYGDVSERLTAASTHLLFFALELNRVDDDVIERAMQTPELGALPAVDRGSAQGQAVSARGPASSSSSMRSPRAAMPPGTGCSTRPSPACASRSAARSSRSSRR